MRRPSRRTTSTPIWPRIGSMLGWKAHVCPEIRPRSGGSEATGVGWRAGGHTNVRRAAGAWGKRWGTLAGSFREAGRILAGRFEGVGAAEAPSDQAGAPGRWRRAGRWASAPGGCHGAGPGRGVPLAHNPRRILAGSFRDPSGKLAGSFRDGSRTIRGRFEGVLAAKAPLDHAGDPGEGAEPGAGRTRPEGALAPARAVASRWSVDPGCLHGYRAKPFWGVHLNPDRQSAEPAQVPAPPHRFRPPGGNR